MARSIFYDSLKRILFAFFATMFIAPVFSATLPAGYTELEYIESTGAQWIDTGYIPTTSLSKIEFKFDIATDNATIFGVENSADSRVQFHHYLSNYVARIFSVGDNVSRVAGSLNTVITGNIDYNNKKLTIGDVVSGETVVSTKTDYSYPIYLFVMNNRGTAGTTITSGKVYYIKVYENGLLVHDFVPAKYTSGNTTTYGMYDLADSNPATAFHTNQGSGTFTAGPVVLDPCRNLFDYNARTIDYYLESDGSLKSQPGDAVSDFIPVEPNTTYHLSATGSRRGKFFDSNKQPIDPSVFDFTTSNGPTSFTTGATTRYVRFGMSGTIYDRTKIQLEQGSTATDYVPYCASTGEIKIATTKYNEDAFANLVTTLNSAITKVTNIVDTTVAQATSIGTLATTKQDRPADGDCPAGRKCLLVTGTDGKPHWYLIQE